MKKFLLLLLVPMVSYAFSPDQFNEDTKKSFQKKFQRVQSRLKEEGIDPKKGIAKIYSQLVRTSIEDVFKNEKALEIANEFYREIENDAQYQQLIQKIKNAKTEEIFEQASYDCMKLVYEKSGQIANKYCPGLEIPQENRKCSNDREWMMIDYPEYFRLNQNKKFDEQEKKYEYKFQNIVWQNWDDDNHQDIVQTYAKKGWHLVQVLIRLDRKRTDYGRNDQTPKHAQLVFEKPIRVKNEDCKNCILGVNAVTSLMMQKMYEVIEKQK